MSKELTPYHYYDRLLLWLDGADPNANDGVNVPANNASLSNWYDKSNNRYVFTATTGNEPTYNSTNKRVDFDGTEHMACTISNFPTEEYHLFVVASITITNDSQTDVILAGDGESLGATTDFTFVAEVDTNSDGTPDQVRPTFSYQGLSSAGSQSCTSTTNAGDGTVGIFEVLAGSASTTFTDINNVNSFSNTDGTGGQNNITAKFGSEYDLKLMKNNESAEQETQGTIHEILMFNKLLPKQDRLGIQGYLKHKYGLSDSVLQPGIDDAGVAYTSHRFISNIPKLLDSVVTTQSGSITANLPDLFGGAHKINPRIPMNYVRLFLTKNDFNANDGIEERDGIKEYYFTQEVGADLKDYIPKSFPCLVSVNTAPVEIVPTKGVSIRSNLTIKLRDFIDSPDTVSFFSKFMAQNPHYLGRTIEVYEGFFDLKGNLQSFDGKKSYTIESMHLNNDMVTIKAKDPLTLADNLKSKVPVPTRFSLAEELGNNDTYSHINLKFDDTALDGSDSDDKAKVTDYFGADNATGFIRINEEILGYRVDVSGSEAALDITSREQWGTKKATSSDSSDNYKVDDSVQKCVFFGDYSDSTQGDTIDVVANELLVNQAGVSSSAVNATTGGLYSWADEKSNWLSAFKINAIFSEPKEINKQLSQLGTMVGVNFFWDDLAGKIRMKAETPELNPQELAKITDNDIILNTFSFINSEKERVSRVYYYYGIKDNTEDRDKPKNYKNLYVNIDATSESADEYGVEANKTIFGWGVTDSTTATSITQRLLNRFKKTPITCQFELDKSFDSLHTGDHFFLSTKHIVDEFGAQKPSVEMQCLSHHYDSNKQCNRIKAKIMRFTSTNSGQVVDSRAIIQAGGSGYQSGETLAFTGGSGANFACTVREIKKVGQFKGTGEFKAAGTRFEVDTTGSTIFFVEGDRLYYSGISNTLQTDPSGNATAKNRGYAIIRHATAIDGSNTQTIILDADVTTVDNDSFFVLSSKASSGVGEVTEITITNNGNSSYAIDEVLTESSGSSGTGFQAKIRHLQTAFASISAGSGTETDTYTGLKATESYISTDSAIPTASGGNNSRHFVTLTLVAGGSGYTNATPQTFSGTEIIGSADGNGLSFTVNVAGNAIGSNFIVTSNPTAGSDYADSANKGYRSGEILNLDESGDSGSGGQVLVTVAAKMSTGTEPYLIV